MWCAVLLNHKLSFFILSIMVSPLEWGPNAWELLHGIAEKVGRQQHTSMIRDEQNELSFVLKSFGSLLPCKTCQEHYREWLTKHPPDKFIFKPYELQEECRKWVYTLHCAVNERKGTNEFKEEDLQDTYSYVDLRKCANTLKTFYQRGLQTGVLKSEEWKRAWKHLDLLLRLL